MLDVGQGLASVVETRNHVLLYDAGAAYPSGFNMGQVAVLPFLRWRGVHSVDKMVISHGDNDHLGGAAWIDAALEVDERYLNDPDHPKALESVRACHRGQKWSWDGVDFAVIWPPRDHSFRGNNASCVILVSAPSGRLLLAGDIESEAEEVLVRQFGQGLSATVLQLPHHGSQTSSSDAFLGSVQPKLAVNSAGFLNRHGHPHQGY